MKTPKFFQLLFLVLCLTSILPTPNGYAGQAASETISLEGVAPDQVNAVLAKMSDEQIRGMLISELEKDLKKDPARRNKPGGLVGKTAKWLHMLDGDKNQQDSSTSLLSYIRKIPADYLAVAKHVGKGSFGNFILTLIMIAAAFGAAWLTEFFVRRFTSNFRKQFQEKAIPVLDGPMRFIAGIMLSIPSFIHIAVFAISSVLFFFILPGSDYPPMRYVFLGFLFVILFYRLLSQFSSIICSPYSAALRVLPIDDKMADMAHKATMTICTYIFAAVVFFATQRELLLSNSTAHATAILFATILIGFLAAIIMRSRKFVTNSILERSDLNQTRNWVIEQFAQFWHVPTILFFIIIWIVMVGDQLSGVERGNSAFLMSLLIIPLFVLFNALGQWVVRGSINTLRIYNHDEEESADEELKKTLSEAKERERKLYVTTSRIMSLSILATLLVWVLSLWGVHIPYATNITNAVFESLVALGLGLTVWKFISSYIEKKMQDSTPVEEEKEDDDEWGGAAARGRSYTLLPMLRKFIASTLLVMVTLVVLSSMGIDIGPLLAGAGVVGLAVGFGAQKMVSDVFSGFFYLLDDAFRVGEYIQASSVSGAVESITLRNVMLRHHRGMLQIVPHSELGSITNFMRGGIIVKFNLEFPYDADVDKIRKVIKKVGQAMLKDEEFKEDFIQPVKSAGVRDITGSIMVIRVKFKAQPGTQFVIKREAYRRITEALTAKGIHYAYRKVIVELPEQEHTISPEEKQRVLEAGAAAALLQQEEEDKKKAEN
jgi:small-conductance mechanosensitive channel